MSTGEKVNAERYSPPEIWKSWFDQRTGDQSRLPSHWYCQSRVAQKKKSRWSACDAASGGSQAWLSFAGNDSW